jgi:hypothetical protein
MGRLLAPSVSLLGQPDDSVGPSLAGLVGQASVPGRQPGEPTKKGHAGTRPRVAFVSLAGFADEDQAPASPKLIVQKNYSFYRGLEERLADAIRLIGAIKSKVFFRLSPHQVA